MALNARPILSFISAFDAEFGETDKGKGNLEAPVFKFSWTGGKVIKNRLRIVEYVTNKEVYNCIITTMSRTHKIHKELPENESIEQKTTYRLENGYKYKAYLSVFTVDDVESLESEAVIFHCVKMPEFKFTNFKDFSGDGDSAIAIIESSSLDCVVDYTQDEKEQENLSSYYYELKDYNGKTIYKSETIYVASWNTTLRFSIGGVDETEKKYDGEIEYDEAYTIICVGETQHGLVLYAEQKFIVKIPVSGVGALIQVKNVGDGRVLISSNYKIMDGICSNENPKYVLDKDGNPYAIDLTQGDYVEFNQGFKMFKPYELIIKGEFKIGKLITLKGKYFINENDYITACGILSLKTIDYTTFRFYYFSFEIEINGILYEVRTDYFRYSKELISAEIDLSCYNGWYNIKSNINYDQDYVAVDNTNDDVLIEILKEYTLSDDDGNIVLTIDSIIANDDEEGNVILI